MRMWKRPPRHATRGGRGSGAEGVPRLRPPPQVQRGPLLRPPHHPSHQAYTMKFLRPFFNYYGGKWRAALHYPGPRYDHIIEPFAGSAGYALRYYQRRITLVDSDPAKKLHSWARGENGQNGTQLHWGHHERVKKRLAEQIPLIRHWNIIAGDYASIPNECATWYVDPPYNNRAGRSYRVKFQDYTALGSWCKSREGQVIVCENVGADWLPFRELGAFKSRNITRTSKEAIWTNVAVEP